MTTEWTCILNLNILEGSHPADQHGRQVEGSVARRQVSPGGQPGSPPGDTVLPVSRYPRVARSLPGVDDQRPHREAGLPSIGVCHLIGQTQTQHVIHSRKMLKEVKRCDYFDN